MTSRAKAFIDRQVKLQSLPERMWDSILAGYVRNQTGMRLKPAGKAKKAARRRAMLARRRNR